MNRALERRWSAQDRSRPAREEMVGARAKARKMTAYEMIEHPAYRYREELEPPHPLPAALRIVAGVSRDAR